MLDKIIKRIVFPHKYSSAAYIKHLRKQGIDIGIHSNIWSPTHVYIDTQRPHMLHIGDYVRITYNVTILAHDFSRVVVVMHDHENIGEAKETWIGDNVFIGMNATILMGAHIGNNCIIGAGSVVSGTIPDGVVVAGNPAKIICTIDEYAKKRRSKTLDEAVLFVKKYKEKYGCYPTVEQIGNVFSWLYLPRTKNIIQKYPKLFQLSTINQEQFEEDFLNSKPVFESYEQFLEYVESK